MVNIFIALICGYLLGSIPAAYVAGRLRKGIDIRTVGSRNMGTLNVYYEVGLVEAILVLLIDVGKGIGAILLVRWLLGMPSLSPFDPITGITALAAVLGHAFPVFLKFRGGKGGATTLGILLFLMPKAIPFFTAIALIALIITHNLTFCYGIAFAIFPFVAWLIYRCEPLIFFSLGLPIFVGINYLPRFKEMHVKTTGDWHKIIKRHSIKERF
ncbi:MAG: glycerol-3-phosphate acyltransferase [Dehalococcoidia bacterium]|nr:glycerol-3-phosphate acyltransferase [Dehalococcoidia bacterium]